MSLTYPTTDLSSGTDLLKILSSYWSALFPDRASLVTYLEGIILEWQQLDGNLKEIQNLNTRDKLPVFHTETWFPLKFKYSETVDSDFWDYKYGDNITYGTSDITYGQIARTDGIAFKLPDSFVGSDMILNKIASSTKTLISKVDYIIDLNTRLIIFNENLFRLEGWQLEPIYDAAGNFIDEELTLWCFNARFDWDYVKDYLGYIFGVLEKSTEIYKDVLNHIWDASTQGLSRLSVKSFISLLTGIPISKSDELIESIFLTNDAQIVVTNKNSYTLNKTSNLDTLYPGYPLYEGDSLCDGFSILELTSGSNLDSIPSSYSEIVLSKEFFDFKIKDALTFRNADSNTWVETDSITGHTLLRFDVFGLEEDVKKFWEYVDAKGIEQGKTLAEYLDTRNNKVGQPDLDSLPSSLNPAKFIVQNFLGNNLFLVSIDLGQLLNPVTYLSYFKLLRRLIPSHTTFLLFINLEKTVEYISLLTGPPDDMETTRRGLYDGTVSEILVGSDPASSGNNCEETYVFMSKITESVRSKLVLNNIW